MKPSLFPRYGLNSMVDFVGKRFRRRTGLNSKQVDNGAGSYTRKNNYFIQNLPQQRITW